MVPKFGASQLIVNWTTPITSEVPHSPIAVSVKFSIIGQVFEKDW